MRYLLDVNALIALGFFEHEFHTRVSKWLTSMNPNTLELLTCSITELGFVRILAHATNYRLSVAQAIDLLLRLKKVRTYKIIFIADDLDVSELPYWVATPARITDGHLFNLAVRNHAVLATLDSGIPRALLIP